jgi:hypothetical protein
MEDSATREGIVLGRMGEGPSLEPGPVELYQSVWPERYFVWDVGRQLWTVWQDNPVTGQQERYEILKAWVDPKTGEHVDEEEVTPDLIRARKVIQAYRAPDYPWAMRRRREWYEFRHGSAKERVKRMMERNNEAKRKKARTLGADAADEIYEARRWLEPIATYDRTKQWHPGERVPVITPGITL